MSQRNTQKKSSLLYCDLDKDTLYSHRFHVTVHPVAAKKLLVQIIPLESHTSQRCRFYQLNVHCNLSDSIILRSDVTIVIPFPAFCPHAHAQLNARLTFKSRVPNTQLFLLLPCYSIPIELAACHFYSCMHVRPRLRLWRRLACADEKGH